MELDHALGEIGDGHRLAHIEDVGHVAMAEGAGLDDEADGLRDRHEVALHALVGDGYRSAGADLALEGRDHAAAAAEDVAEADAAHGEPGFLADDGDGQLGETLGRAHDAGGAHGLVGGDEHEPLGAGRRGMAHDDIGPDDIGLQRLAGLGLHRGNMLVGGGMEDDLRAERPEDAPDAGRIRHRGDDHLDIDIGLLAPNVERQIVQAGLVRIEKHELLRTEIGDLRRELRADRPGRAGHQHAPSADELQAAVAIRLDDGPAKDIDRSHGFERRDRAIALEDGSDRRHGQHAGAGRARDLAETGMCRGRRRWNSDDDDVDTLGLHERRNGVGVAKHRETSDEASDLPVVVVDETTGP